MSDVSLSFFARLKLALAFLFGGKWPEAPAAALPAGPAPVPAPVVVAAPPKPEEIQAAALFFLSILQREGRLIDFLQEDVATFSDADVGAAARVVHEGCRKVLKQYLPLEPVLRESEGASVTVPAGFDANRYRLTGNVTGTAPFKGSLKHHGWVASEVKLPPPPSSLDVKVIAPAEVELP